MRARGVVLSVAAMLLAAAAVGLAGTTRVESGTRTVQWRAGRPESARELTPGLRWSIPLGRRVHRGACERPVGDAQAAFEATGAEGARWVWTGAWSARVSPDAPAAAVAACVESAVPASWRTALESAFNEAVRTRDGAASATPTTAFRPLAEAALAALGGRLESWSGVAAAGSGPPAVAADRPATNLLVVGWDGADWDVLDPLLERGDLPHLKSLIDGGVRARLRSMPPILSPVVWTSIATGKVPAKHGIFDFLARADDGTPVPVTSSLRRARPVWDLLGRGGVEVSVTAWWATWPAEAVQGRMATDRIAYQLFEEVVDVGARDDPTGKTWPPDLFDEVLPRLVSPEAVDDDTLRAFGVDPTVAARSADARERLDELRTVLASTATYGAIAERFLDLAPRGFHAAYYELTDTTAHVFMPFRPPAVAGSDPELAAAFADVVDRAYLEADAALGRLLAKLDGEWHVMVLSDHGFKHGANRPATDPRVGHGPAADWHDRFGIWVFSGPGVRRGVEIEAPTILDVAPTILALYGMPVAEDMDGRIVSEAFLPGFLDDAPPTIATYEYASREPVRLAASAQDDALMEKLRSLGYVGAPGTSAPERSSGGGNSTGSASGPEHTGTALNNLGVSQLSQGELGAALETFERALAAGGGIPSLVNLANVHLLRRDLVAAEQVIALLEEENPGFRAIPALRGRLADLAGDRTAAAAWLERAIALDPSDARSMTRRGHLAEERGDLEQARKYFERAARTNPENPDAPNYLGNVLRASGDLAGAEAAYRAAIDADPAYPGGYNNLGVLLQSLGRDEEAERWLRRGVERAPASALLRNSLGALLLRNGDPEAREQIDLALEFDPELPEAWSNRGVLFAQAGDADGAREAFERALSADPDHVDAHFNLAKLAMLERRFDQAHASFARASDLAPSHLDAAIGAGETAFRLGRADVARSYFTRAAGLAGAPARVSERLRELDGGG